MIGTLRSVRSLPFAAFAALKTLLFPSRAWLARIDAAPHDGVNCLVTIICDPRVAADAHAELLHEVHAGPFDLCWIYSTSGGAAGLLELGALLTSPRGNEEAAQQLFDRLRAKPAVVTARWRVVANADR